MLPHRCLRIKSQPAIKTKKREIKPTEKRIELGKAAQKLKVNIIELVENQQINNEA